MLRSEVKSTNARPPVSSQRATSSSLTASTKPGSRGSDEVGGQVERGLAREVERRLHLHRLDVAEVLRGERAVEAHPPGEEVEPSLRR